MPELTATARCLACGPLTAGDPAAADRAAERHVKAGHPTATVITPKENTR